MTQVRINSNSPSIQQIEAEPEKFALSDQDINKLFVAADFPKFDVIELKKEEHISKNALAIFFISKIENWNRISNLPEDTMNLRTEYFTTEFIYSSLKRIADMKENQVDPQLKILYRWYIGSCRKKPQGIPTMPQKYCKNEAYQAIKSFKTNPTLLIDEYRRKHFDIKLSKKSSQLQQEQIAVMNETFNKKLKMKLQNNFVTSPPALNQIKVQPNNIEKVYHKQLKHMKANIGSSGSMIKRTCSSDQIRHQEVRRHRQMMELKRSQDRWKNQKSRLAQQISKDYFCGDFDTSARMVKSSQGNRSMAQQQLRKIKEYRVQTSSNKIRVCQTEKSEKQSVMPELAPIWNMGLMKNPNQQKIKKKRGKTQRKKN